MMQAGNKTFHDSPGDQLERADARKDLGREKPGGYVLANGESHDLLERLQHQVEAIAN